MYLNTRFTTRKSANVKQKADPLSHQSLSHHSLLNQPGLLNQPNQQSLQQHQHSHISTASPAPHTRYIGVDLEEVAQLRQECAQLNQKLSQKDSQIERIQRSFEDTRSSLKEIEGRHHQEILAHQQTQQSHQQALQSYSDISERHTQYELQYDTAIREYEHRIMDKERLLAHLQAEALATTARVQTAECLSAAREDACKKQEAVYQQALMQVSPSELQKQCDSLQKRLHTKTVEVEVARCERENAIEMCDRLTHQLKNSLKDAEERENVIERLKQKNSVLETKAVELENAENQIKHLIAQRSELYERIKTHTEESSRLQLTCDDLISRLHSCSVNTPLNFIQIPPAAFIVPDIYTHTHTHTHMHKHSNSLLNIGENMSESNTHTHTNDGQNGHTHTHTHTNTPPRISLTHTTSQLDIIGTSPRDATHVNDEGATEAGSPSHERHMQDVCTQLPSRMGSQQHNGAPDVAVQVNPLISQAVSSDEFKGAPGMNLAAMRKQVEETYIESLRERQHSQLVEEIKGLLLQVHVADNDKSTYNLELNRLRRMLTVKDIEVINRDKQRETDANAHRLIQEEVNEIKLKIKQSDEIIQTYEYCFFYIYLFFNLF
eukprot:GHVR01117460.1.p1 GENE.GHVR01117460.1~~GHVR01117460.1.p1  ORF type:complete len:606 (+),score=180.90 GHVR01117460.1:6-1823(+)